MRLRFAGSLITLFALTMSTHAQTRTTLNALRDTARPLLIFAGAEDPRAQQQLSELAGHAGELRERDMRVILMDPTPHLDHSPPDLPEATFTPQEAAHARQRFHVGQNEFAVILVGKDGGEKLRSSKPIVWQTLASTIDSMPMRKDEMKQR